MNLPVLFALGVLTPSSVYPITTQGPVTTVPERTVTFILVPKPSQTGLTTKSATVWLAPYDPSDRDQRAASYAPLLGAALIASIQAVSLTPEALALGLSLDTDRPPVISDVDGQAVGLWLRAAVNVQHDPSFDADGQIVGIDILIRDDSTPFREFDRTGAQVVRQL